MQVTASSSCTLRLRNTAFQAATDSGGVSSPPGTVANTEVAATALATASTKYVADHPKCAPSKLTSGTPTASATDQPRKMKATDPARCSGAMNSAIALAACGVNTAAPPTIARRIASNTPKLGANADAAWPTTYRSRAVVSSRRRSRRFVRNASNGASTQSTAAP